MEITKEEALDYVKHSSESMEDGEKEHAQTVKIEGQNFYHLKELKINGEIKAMARKDIINMRRKWSKSILICIISIVFFDFLVIILLGFGIMKFPDGFIIPTFIADSLLKTLGLAVIVVHFLFNKDTL